MVAKITVILFIILCLMVGVFLTLLPWISIGGFVDWGDNYLLMTVAQKTGLPIIQKVVGSGWFRGAITGLGILNIFLAFWELAHFKQSVRMLEEEDAVLESKRLEMSRK
ncbi:MAG: hypothetical protein R2747_07450 [Pyrinomonadaceae bacterium]